MKLINAYIVVSPERGSCMFSEKELKGFKDIDIDKVNKCELVELENIILDKEDSKINKLVCYMQQIKNPYCYKCGDVGVKLEFTQSSISLEDLLTKFLIYKKQS